MRPTCDAYVEEVQLLISLYDFSPLIDPDECVPDAAIVCRLMNAHINMQSSTSGLLSQSLYKFARVYGLN